MASIIIAPIKPFKKEDSSKILLEFEEMFNIIGLGKLKRSRNQWFLQGVSLDG